MEKIKKKGLISITLGIVSLFYFPYLRTFDKQILSLLNAISTKYHLYWIYDHSLIITASPFVLFAILGIIFSIKARKSEEKLFSTIGIVLSFLGLLIVVGCVSFIYLVGRFWGG
jgi:hypothetical protein